MSKLNNFHYAISLAQMLYDIEGDEEDLEETGLIAPLLVNYFHKNKTLNKSEYRFLKDKDIILINNYFLRYCPPYREKMRNPKFLLQQYS